jgi:hypothetical protein
MDRLLRHWPIGYSPAVRHPWGRHSAVVVQTFLGAGRTSGGAICLSDCSQSVRAQVLVLILASPVMMMARVHGETRDYLSASLLDPLIELVGLANMLQSEFTRTQ